jgi:pyridoxal phosphate enzyme (YggS family)
MTSALHDNLHRVQDRVAAAAARAGRDPAAITLVAVSKTHPVDTLLEAYALGVRHFGENRVAEALGKLPAFRHAVPDAQATFHMIGHLQSRKAEPAVTLFDWVHSVDNLKLARRLDRFAGEQHKQMPVLLEVNVSGEASKYGLDRAHIDELHRAVDELSTLSHIRLAGLMTMAPIVSDPELTRPVFRGLRDLRDELQRRDSAVHLPHLSMGMTDDFEVAIEEGATLIRVGRAIFGERL